MLLFHSYIALLITNQEKLTLVLCTEKASIATTHPFILQSSTVAFIYSQCNDTQRILTVHTLHTVHTLFTRRVLVLE